MIKKNNYFLYCIFNFIILLFVTGCQRLPSFSSNTVLRHIQSELATEIAYNTQCDPCRPLAPSSVRDSLVPNILALDSRIIKADNLNRFDVVADRVPAKIFFANLIGDSKENILINPNVTGEISVSLKKVTVKQVLYAVRDLYGFEYRFGQAGIEVYKPELQTKAFRVNYLNLNRDGASDMQVKSGSLGSAGSSSSNYSSTDSSGTSSTSSINTKANSRISTNSNTDFWNELRQALELIIYNEADKQKTIEKTATSTTTTTPTTVPNTIVPAITTSPASATTTSSEVISSETKRIAISPLAGLVVVQAYPHELRKVQSFLDNAELSLNRQVLLEAKILEVELNEGFSSGINWAVVSGGLRATQVGSNVLDSSINVPDLPGGVPFPGSPTVNLNPGSGLASLGTAGTQSQLFGGVMTLGMNFSKLASFVELLSGQGKVQVLSSPKISTTNNQKALIKVGSDDFFITNIQASDIVTSGSIATVPTLPDITFESYFSGIALDVTPQINQNNYVTLHVHPIVSNVTEKVKSVTISNVTVSYPLASSSIRETDTIVRALSGEVVVLGGLMQDRKDTIVTGVPVLKNLPVLGRVFRHERVKQTKSELVILLRPIVVDNCTWNNAMQDSLERFGALETHDYQCIDGSDPYGAHGYSGPNFVSTGPICPAELMDEKLSYGTY